MLLTLKPPRLNGIADGPIPRAPSPPHRITSVLSTPRTSAPEPRSARPEVMNPAPTPHDTPADFVQRNFPSMAMSLPAIGSMPAAVAQQSTPHWQQSEESVRLWLQAKAEEDRTRQEEEKTRQESFKLDQRRVEQAMLRDSLQAGVPAYMIPFIFTGLGGGNLQWAQQYISQMSAGPMRPQQVPNQAVPLAIAQAQQQQPEEYPPTQQSRLASQSLPSGPAQQQAVIQTQQVALDVPRDNRMIPPNPYANSRPIPTPTRPAVQQTPPSPAQNPYTRVSPPRQQHSVPASSLTQPTATLSRMNSTEMHIQPPPSNIGVRAPAPPTPGTRAPHSQQGTSMKGENLYFHHWVPPSNPNTPSGKSPNISPNSGHPNSHLRSEYQNSPRKRKAQGSHPPVPPPASHLSESNSADPAPARQQQLQRRNTGHSRHRNGSGSQNIDVVVANLPESGRSSGQISVNTLVSHPERTLSQSSHREEPTSASSDPNQLGQDGGLSRHRKNTVSRENSISNASLRNESSGYQMEDNARKHSSGSQSGGISGHVSFSSGYHHPHDVPNNIGVDSMGRTAHSAVHMLDMNHTSGHQPAMVHSNQI